MALDDLRVPPGNRLEKLAATREGQHSIRINDQWRVCFIWRTATRATLRSSTTTEEVHMDEQLDPVHPGEVLLEEFLKPLGLRQNRLARSLGVPPRRINEIVLGKRRITADTALRLARFFGTSGRFWLNLQATSRASTSNGTDWLGSGTEVEILRRAS